MSTGQKLAVWYAFMGILMLGIIVHWIVIGRFHFFWFIPLGILLAAYGVWTIREFGGHKPATARKKRRRSGRGQKPMIWIVGLVLLVFAVANEALIDAPTGPLWRVIVSILIFLYLWWLSSLLFDLAFVWHRYIRGDAARRFLRETVKRPSFAPENDPKSPAEL